MNKILFFIILLVLIASGFVYLINNASKTTTATVVAPTYYEAQWIGNSVVNTSGDQTFASTAFTLDSKAPSTLPSSFATTSSFFGVTVPATGVYTFNWTVRGNVQNGFQYTRDVWSYIGFHKSNGVAYTTLGTTPALAQRPSMTQMTYVNSGMTFEINVSCTQTCKQGDIVAPWVGSNNNGTVGISVDLANSRFSMYEQV
ncbi:MAG: hypothetical protein EOP45_22970 [Sphingobacteriaceae bacterium]|nr:MAG: hypothetical protein EOP45_22970 [Sphingobacteriaceae bacterium]